MHAILLALILGANFSEDRLLDTFPKYPAGGCATWTNGSTLCCSSAGVCQLGVSDSLGTLQLASVVASSTIQAASFTAAAAGDIYFGNRELMYSAADDSWGISNAANTHGIRISTGTDGTAAFQTRIGTDAATVQSSAMTTGSIGTGTTTALSLSGANNSVGNFSVNTSSMTVDATTGEIGTIDGALTAATMTAVKSAKLKGSSHEYAWTNAMVTALGAVTAGDISIATLPARTRVKNVLLVVDTACAGTTTLTGAVGRAGTSYQDYVMASNLQAAANTTYGKAAVDRGVNMSGFDVPSYTGTTTVYLHLVSTGGNLSSATTCTGHVDLETELVF